MAVNDQALASLPCGVALDDLIAQVTGGAASLDRAHQAACEFCEAALEAIRRAWEDFQDLARAAVVVPDDLADRVMRRVRELSTGTAGGVLVHEQRGRTHVAERVVHAAARAAALSVPGVVWASATAPEPQDAMPDQLVVLVRIIVGWDVAMPPLGEAVRERVIDLVAVQTGAAIDRVEIAVQDIAVPEVTGRGFTADRQNL